MDCISFKNPGRMDIPVNFVSLLIAVITIFFYGLVLAGVIRNGNAVSDQLYNPFIYINYGAFW